MRRLLLMVAMVTSVLATGPGEAAANERDPLAIAEEVSDVPLGAPVKTLQKYLTDRLTAQYRPLIKAAHDPVRRDELKRELPERIRSIESTYLELTGPASGYDVSLLAGEFRTGSGDAIIQQSLGATDRYYFFNAGRLWKVIATAPPGYDFGSTVARLARRYGKPETLQFMAGDEALPPSRASWRTTGGIIEVSDRRSEYGCYTIIWAEPSLWTARAGDRASIGGAPRLDPLVKEITSDGNPKDVSNIVDQILQGGEAQPKPPSE